MISFEDVSFAYAGAPDRPVLRTVSLRISAGERVAVVGPNGSGKSTLARLVNGLLVPTTGRVSVDGIDSRDAARIWELRARVAMVFQDPEDQIVATSVEDEVAFGPENLGMPREELRTRVDEALVAVGLAGFERREPHLLSGGQKQRLAVAGALAMRPACLVFDEPTSMLDPIGRSEVLAVIEALSRSERTIVHVTHDISEALLADRVLVLRDGAIAYDGSPAHLLDDDAPLDAWGLELPPLGRLALALKVAGALRGSVRLEPTAIVEAAWHSS